MPVSVTALIKVLDDYGCFPLWVQDDPEEPFLPYDPANLDLTPALIGRLGA